MTAKTITGARALKRELDRVRAQGWAVVPDEGSIGFNALAVPVLDAQAALAAVVGVIGPKRGLPEKPSQDLIKSIKRVGETISRTLGHDSDAEP